MIPLDHFLYLSAILFAIGFILLVVKRNVIVALMGVELMLNAVNINLAAFSYFDPSLSGQMFVLFVIVIAVAEAAVALAIIFQVYQYYKTSNLDQFDSLRK